MPRRSSIELTFREVTGTSTDTSVPARVVVDWIDKTAYASAASWAGSQCVTSYVGNMHFIVPVPRDSPVRVQARLVHTSKNSIHIQTRVLVPSAHDHEKWVTATECFMIYLAVGSDGETLEVEPFKPRTELERRRDLDASRRMVHRREIEETIRSLPDAKAAPEALVLRFIADTEERYPDGAIRGGAVMRWIDEAAEIAAERYCGFDVTSVLGGGVRFYRPITVGELVEVEARLVLTGSKSMHVLVRLRAGDRRERQPKDVAYGLPVMVAPDGQGSARFIPGWQPISDEDHAAAAQARRIRDLRNATVVTPSPVSDSLGGNSLDASSGSAETLQQW